MILTTSIIVLIGGYVVVFVWRRFAAHKSKPLKPPKCIVKKLSNIKLDDGTKKVTIFFGILTGTTEGFSKAITEGAKARYEKAMFRVSDLDDYVADDEKYEARLKKEKHVLFLLAT